MPRQPWEKDYPHRRTKIMFLFLDEPEEGVIHGGWLLLIILAGKNDIKDLF